MSRRAAAILLRSPAASCWRSPSRPCSSSTAAACPDSRAAGRGRSCASPPARPVTAPPGATPRARRRDDPDHALLSGPERDAPASRRTGHRKPAGGPAFLRALFAELQKGPTREGLMAAVPEKMQLRNAFLLPEGQAVLDLAVDAGLAFGSDEELTIVASLVNTTLQNVAETSRVRILVNGEPAETLGGHVDLTRPLLSPPQRHRAAGSRADGDGDGAVTPTTAPTRNRPPRGHSPARGPAMTRVDAAPGRTKTRRAARGHDRDRRRPSRGGLGADLARPHEGPLRGVGRRPRARRS